ncbi:MAG: nodulation protein NfeD [Acidobacteria bacterium]|nr:nodulation protein NfeD [Acidobacteriota bacterium]MYD69714.1 nodulation protein NfeD [Acidobacteriota bacterium]MYJ03589.1 nodulation protein NfeD [Acidobacteriota bacterium]
MSLRHARRRIRPGLWLTLISWGLLLAGAIAHPFLQAQEPEGNTSEGNGDSARRTDRALVYAADVDALIHPVSAEFIAQTIEKADADSADFVVLTLRTPGGLVDSTREINQSIIEADTPVAVWVGPSGARAASAGFLITIAADIAAMAPGTHIGAAHPVSGTGEAMDETAAEKAASDVAAYARSLASRRGRNISLAEEAVTESRSFTEEEALEADPPLIDLIADDVDDLIAQLEGRDIRRWDGTSVVVQLDGADIQPVEMTWRQRLLSAVAHPQIAVLLFSLGSLGLTIELWNPGSIVPGVVGGLCLLLAFFAFQILPTNYVGLLLIAFGLLLLVAEMFTPTFGILATGGLVSMLMGGLLLFDSELPELQLGWPFLLGTMLALGFITAALAHLGIRAHRMRAVTGRSGMIDSPGRALGPIPAGGSGRVETHGEIWTAVADDPIGDGDAVRVVAVEGMTLRVERAGAKKP